MTDIAEDNAPGKASRVLVAEYLLANSAASQTAGRSMLDEAEAMLTAVVADIARLPNIDVTVLLSSDATTQFAELDNFRMAESRNRIFIQRGELQPDTLPAILRGDPQLAAFDAVLLIAPECNGVLVSLLKVAEKLAAWPMLRLNLDWRLAEIFADKRTTDVWLRQHGIATIPTRTIDDPTARALRGTFRQSSPSASVTDKLRSIKDQPAILKPRDGAGADGVRIVQLRHLLFEHLPQQRSDNDRWILQPFIPGVACSVGFIGGGQRCSTTILPPARQNIRINADELSYHGGQIPCESAIASRVAPVAEQIAAALGSFNGYVGADLLVDPSGSEVSEASVRVVEINPRLCTSYVGYRAIAEDNLAAWMLQQHECTTICWKPGAVTFSANGETHLTATPTA